jgi:transcriptional regulator
MHVPPAFREDDRTAMFETMRAAPLAQFVTATTDGPLCTPLPLLVAADEGEYGTIYGHLARANPQWHTPIVGEALAVFAGPDAYISPSWYATKRETGKVVPTWNYVTVHAHGSAEFFDDAERLLDVVSRLTVHHESGRAEPWAVDDAPADFIAAQLRGIVGLRMPISRLDGKAKLSQNRNAADRAGVGAALSDSDRQGDRAIGRLIPQ